MKKCGKKIESDAFVMRVCHFTYSFFPVVGGMEEVIHNISVSMLSQGCKPYVFAPSVRGKNNRLNVPYNVLRYSRPSSRRFGLRQLLIPLLWYHRKYHFDVLHCHGVYPPGYVGASFHKISGVPLVITPHGGDIKTDHKGYIINQRVTERIIRTFASAQAVTAISSDIRDRVLKLGAPDDKIHLIPNGVFTDNFKTASMYHEKKSHDNPYIVYLGRLEKVKGIDVLLRAFSIVNKDYPGLKLKIAGTGKEISNLQTLAEDLDISNEIDFLGIVEGNKKIELLQNALFLICPSRYESFGVVILEAFASGIPVVATNVGGIPDIIKDGENGFLVEPANPQKLAEKIIILLNNPALRITMAQNAQKSNNIYDWNDIVKKYINIYSRIR
jgi:glycosyltransferase involved in cell wall biosynthesis